jgi:hypothetical protein
MIPNYSYIYSFCTHVLSPSFSHFLSPCISLCMFLARVYSGHVFIVIFLIFAHCISLSHSILHTVHVRTSLDMQVRPRADFCTPATCCSHFSMFCSIFIRFVRSSRANGVAITLLVYLTFSLVVECSLLYRTQFTCERGWHFYFLFFFQLVSGRYFCTRGDVLGYVSFFLLFLPGVIWFIILKYIYIILQYYILCYIYNIIYILYYIYYIIYITIYIYILF